MELKFQIKWLNKNIYNLHGIKIVHDKSKKTRNKEEWTHTISLFSRGLHILKFDYISKSKKVGNKTIALAIQENELSQIWIIRELFKI